MLKAYEFTKIELLHRYVVRDMTTNAERISVMKTDCDATFCKLISHAEEL